MENHDFRDQMNIEDMMSKIKTIIETFDSDKELVITIDDGTVNQRSPIDLDINNVKIVTTEGFGLLNELQTREYIKVTLPDDRIGVFHISEVRQLPNQNVFSKDRPISYLIKVREGWWYTFRPDLVSVKGPSMLPGPRYDDKAVTPGFVLRDDEDFEFLSKAEYDYIKGHFNFMMNNPIVK